MQVSQLWRYPVKSFGGEQLQSAAIESDGLRGDHMWAVIDAETGTVASAKKVRAWSRLLECRARLLDDADPSDPSVLEIKLPDGRCTRGDDPRTPGLLSELTGRALTLEARPRTYDEAPLHLLTTAAVEALGTGDTAGVALRRFRPNLVVSTDDTGFVEDDWLGRRIEAGSVALVPTQRTARCVMVTLPHQEVPARRDMLRTVTDRNRVPNRAGGKPAPCIGVYADVVSDGVLAVGDSLIVR
ncbi:MOSC N-terminal beta barrel domain-containing protein [Rhodococcus sp. DMU1]|uniref:MOSC domain-containing protein n=1 Tax=Rhodococcus sp. DMU1 TaxID=2722825 RepID=UPI00143E90C9|nr:MOSC N-terminal beta barrel domain-containing protein [Rhodococcus sp. DMU1]QIX52356.1 MOSC domain-containing protein [Rhodococcus sp. DMU1]